MATRGEVAQLLVLFIAYLDDAIDKSIPIVVVMVEGNGTHFLLGLLYLAQGIFMILEVDLCEVVTARQP